MDADIKGLHEVAVTTERMLLYYVAHDVLAAEARNFAESRGWGRNATGQPPGREWMRGDDSALPASIRVLKPSSVQIWRDHIYIGFGGALHHLGISVFRGDSVGEGTKELAKGVWYSAEGNRTVEGAAPEI